PCSRCIGKRRTWNKCGRIKRLCDGGCSLFFYSFCNRRGYPGAAVHVHTWHWGNYHKCCAQFHRAFCHWCSYHPFYRSECLELRCKTGIVWAKCCCCYLWNRKANRSVPHLVQELLSWQDLLKDKVL